MTLIVDILNRVARQVSVAAPSSWVSATADEYVEIRDDFLRQAVEDVIERFDWPQPISAEVDIVGDGSESYDLPATFLRMHRDDRAVHDATYTRWTCPVTTDSDWSLLRAQGLSGADRAFRVTGYAGNFDISFLPALSTTVTVHYVTTYWKANASGTLGDTFSAEDDVLLLPDRLVEASIVWRWRQRRGLPYEDKYAEAEALLAKSINDARNHRVISMGGKRYVRWQDNVPATIPS